MTAATTCDEEIVMQSENLEEKRRTAVFGVTKRKKSKKTQKQAITYRCDGNL